MSATLELKPRLTTLPSQERARLEGRAKLLAVWLFTGGRGSSHTAERRAQQLVAVGYALLVAYASVEATRDLLDSHRPGASWVGSLSRFTAPTTPVLARLKRSVGRQLGSSATVSEAGQNMICAYLSLALLVGLLANAVLGRWWADPVAALVIAVVAAREGVAAGTATAVTAASPAAQLLNV